MHKDKQPKNTKISGCMISKSLVLHNNL